MPDDKGSIPEQFGLSRRGTGGGVIEHELHQALARL